jgi:DnaJ-class molecular chaperone
MLRYGIVVMPGTGQAKNTKQKKVSCPDCHGIGRTLVTDILRKEKDLGDCRTCGGTGKVPIEKALDIVAVTR